MLYHERERKNKENAKDQGVLMVPEYLNNILVAYSHIKRTCTGEKFELNGLLLGSYGKLKWVG